MKKHKAIQKIIVKSIIVVKDVAAQIKSSLEIKRPSVSFEIFLN